MKPPNAPYDHRQELLEQKSGSSAAALAILEAEVKARLAELEAANKALEARVAGTRETLEQQLQQHTQQFNSKVLMTYPPTPQPFSANHAFLAVPIP